MVVCDAPAYDYDTVITPAHSFTYWSERFAFGSKRDEFIRWSIDGSRCGGHLCCVPRLHGRCAEHEKRAEELRWVQCDAELCYETRQKPRAKRSPEPERAPWLSIQVIDWP